MLHEVVHPQHLPESDALTVSNVAVRYPQTATALVVAHPLGEHVETLTMACEFDVMEAIKGDDLKASSTMRHDALRPCDGCTLPDIRLHGFLRQTDAMVEVFYLVPRLHRVRTTRENVGIWSNSSQNVRRWWGLWVRFKAVLRGGRGRRARMVVTRDGVGVGRNVRVGTANGGGDEQND